MILLFFAISAIALILTTAILRTSPVKNYYKFISIFMIFAIIYSGWFYALSVSGYAFNHSLPDKFQLIWGQEIQQTKIELWVNPSEGNGFSKSSRLYSVPWTQNLSNQLSEAKKSLAKGVPVVMGKDKNSNKGKGGIAGMLKNASNAMMSNTGGGENLQFLSNATSLPQK
jgi:hypothetical protein